jgi:hypothetical protein
VLWVLPDEAARFARIGTFSDGQNSSLKKGSTILNIFPPSK